jgi:hypothetical protein
LEIAALRQQIKIYQRQVRRPRLVRRDPIFWIWLQRHWDGWRRADHPEWGEDRIALELKLKLGVEHSTSTIRRYMVEGGNLGQAAVTGGDALVQRTSIPAPRQRRHLRTVRATDALRRNKGLHHDYRLAA